MRSLFLTFFVAASVCAQDTEWVRDWERAQKDRPDVVRSVARIAAVDEPGTPLIVHGRIFKADGVTPAPDVVVFAYQTDAAGLYNAPGERAWRLRGWAKSDAQGRFEFRTIRPASYPRNGPPAHIHLTIDGPGLRRRWTEDIEFSDDPVLSDAHKQRSAAKGRFGSVRAVTKRGGVQRVEAHLRIEESGLF